jgi:hypothetical protein
LGVGGGTYAISFEYVVTLPPPYSETAVLDNLQLTMVPEPGTFAFFGLGALVLGVFARNSPGQRPVPAGAQKANSC